MQTEAHPQATAVRLAFVLFGIAPIGCAGGSSSREVGTAAETPIRVCVGTATP
jgi:hypothetical protein